MSFQTIDTRNWYFKTEDYPLYTADMMNNMKYVNIHLQTNGSANVMSQDFLLSVSCKMRCNSSEEIT